MVVSTQTESLRWLGTVSPRSSTALIRWVELTNSNGHEAGSVMQRTVELEPNSAKSELTMTGFDITCCRKENMIHVDKRPGTAITGVTSWLLADSEENPDR